MPSARAHTAGRLDTVLVGLGLVDSRNRAAREIRAGRVTVDGGVVTRPSASIAVDSHITVDSPEHWVARSAHKLLGALEDMGAAPAVRGAVCLDAGASTGGFTQVLLEHGAVAVHAVDVGHGQLVPRIAGDDRVHDLPGTNVRTLTVRISPPPVASVPRGRDSGPRRRRPLIHLPDARDRCAARPSPATEHCSCSW